MGLLRATSKMSASSDLLWALTKKSNAFLVKRNGLMLTSEPNNLMNKHSFKFSGLANDEAVGVDDNTRGIVLNLKNKKSVTQPKKNVANIPLKKGGMRKVAKAIKARTEGKFYRRDLTKPALARWYKIWLSQNSASIQS